MKEESFFKYPNNKQENWVSYRDSIEFKRGLKELEEMSSVGSQSKVIILAVALNLKKAGGFYFNTETATHNDIEKMLSDLGVYFFRDIKDEERLKLRKDMYSHSGSYLIGSTAESIGDAMEARQFSHKDLKTRHKVYGEAMDFPKTSVEAFAERYDLDKDDDKDTLIDVWDKDKDKLTDEERAFIFFRLSKDNWEEEIQWLEQIISGVKEYSPEIYKEVMMNYTG
jgi:hypothetical protein